MTEAEHAQTLDLLRDPKLLDRLLADSDTLFSTGWKLTRLTIAPGDIVAAIDLRVEAVFSNLTARGAEKNLCRS